MEKERRRKSKISRLRREGERALTQIKKKNREKEKNRAGGVDDNETGIQPPAPNVANMIIKGAEMSSPASAAKL